MKRLSNFLKDKIQEELPAQTQPDGSISPEDLHRHFDVNGDGKVCMHDYASQVAFHNQHPEYLEPYMQTLDQTQKSHASGNIVNHEDPLHNMFKTNMAFVAKSMPELGEGVQVHEHEKDPPVILVMRRKSIRMFPNGQKVAMYYVDKLDKYVTVPYNDLQWSPLSMKEDVSYSVIHQLSTIILEGVGTVKFEDGSYTKVDKETANSILTVYESLDKKNKQIIENMANESKQNFSKVIDFAWKYVK